MAEIQQDSGGGKGKSHQKKMHIRVDFTPMVDMNMLLITFFMLCTTMIKSQTLSISLPSNEQLQENQRGNDVSEDDVITIIIDAKRKPGTNEVDSVNHKVVNEIYYYRGKPFNGLDTIAAYNNLEKSEFLTDDVNASGAHSSRGIRAILQEKNKEVYGQIQALKEKYNAGGFGKLDTDAERKVAMEKYNEAAKEVRKNESLYRPTIIIKSTPDATYGGLVEILDEMQINQMPIYRINDMTVLDYSLLRTYTPK